MIDVLTYTLAGLFLLGCAVGAGFMVVGIVRDLRRPD